MGNRSERKVKNLFINKGLQFRVIITSMLYMFLVMVVSIGLVLSPLMYDMIASTDIAVQYKAAQTFLVIAKRLMPSTMVLFSLYFIHQLIITHRVCGPLVNFTNTFGCIANGELTRKVYLRNGDYLKNEADEINNMIDGLADHVRSIKANQDKVVDALNEVLGNVDDPATKEKIERVLDETKDSFAMFKLEDTANPV